MRIIVVEIIDNINKLKEHRDTWDKILVENKNDNPFLEQDWIINWWKYFGVEHELYIILIKDEDNILGFCPLMKTKRILYTEISFIAYRWYCYMDFVIINKHGEKAIEYLVAYLENLKGSLIINLDNIVETSENLNMLMSFLIENKARYFTKNIEARHININGSNFEILFMGGATITIKGNFKSVSYLGYE